jgi:hypothetical protein
MYWPKIVEQLDHCGINDRATQVAAIGTIAIETASTFRADPRVRHTRPTGQATAAAPGTPGAASSS